MYILYILSDLDPSHTGSKRKLLTSCLFQYNGMHYSSIKQFDRLDGAVVRAELSNSWGSVGHIAHMSNRAEGRMEFSIWISPLLREKISVM